jgi:peptidyl-prolyl cis-trans isomerase D
MRGKAGKAMMLLLAVAFAGWIVFELGMDISGQSPGGGANDLGRVNGRPIPYAAYQAAYQELYQNAQQQLGGQISREQQRALEEEAWNRVVTDVLLAQEMERRGIRATNAEIRMAARTNPHPSLVQQEIFQTEGQFDLAKYQQFLDGPMADNALLLQLEAYYRDAVPRSKLFRQVTAGAYVSEAELWRAWRDQNESATVDYLRLPEDRLVPGTVTVTDDQIRRRYRERREDLKQPATARVTLALLPKGVDAADSAAAVTRAQQLRAEIAGGADFAAVARRESTDPGSREAGGALGTFGRGQMVPEFERAAFSLPIGQVSEPVISPFGVHLIQVQERTGDQVTARHILIPLQKAEEALDQLGARADSLERLAETAGVERAAQRFGLEVRRGVNVSEASPFVPGIGSALEAIEWAQEERTRQDGQPAATTSPVFETEQAYYIARLEQFSPAGVPSLEAATPGIRAELIREAKRARAREIGQQMVAQLRSGTPLAEVARARGLEVQTAGPFTRVNPNPALGQANAVVGAAFGTPVNGVSDVVEAPAGLFIVRPVARTEADRAAWAAQKEQQRSAALQGVERAQLQRWMEELRREARIEDRRSEVLRRQV